MSDWEADDAALIDCPRGELSCCACDAAAAAECGMAGAASVVNVPVGKKSVNNFIFCRR